MIKAFSPERAELFCSQQSFSGLTSGQMRDGSGGGCRFAEPLQVLNATSRNICPGKAFSLDYN